MNRHVWQACDRAAGFSFVELLVTIVIAGIAFAAMVPVFVAAQQRGAGDNARNQALSLARDRIEKIRVLDYDQIYEANLKSSTWFGGEFGDTASISNGGGGSKTYSVEYSVLFVGGQGDGEHAVSPTDAATFGQSEKYKQVTVSVEWAGNPKPVKKVVLSTTIYKQYQGTRIETLVVQGLHGGVDAADANRQFVTATPVTFTAFVNDSDASRTSGVTFLVYNTNGLVSTLTCLAADSVAGVYEVQWNPGGAAGSVDGVYTVKATATNINGYAVNTVTATFSLETGAPPQIVATATGYDHAIDLVWSDTTAGDVTHYLVTRMDPPTPTTNTATYPAVPTYQIPFEGGTGMPSKLDTGLDAKDYENNDPYVEPGDSEYLVYYEIVAVDSIGRASTPAVVSAIPHLSSDSVAPTTPTNFSGSVTSSSAPPLWVQLTWGFSTDPTGSGSTSGMKGYRVYRRNLDPKTAAWSPWTLVTTVPHVADTVANPTYSWTDSTPGPLIQYEYFVTAIDNDYNESTPTTTLTFTVPNYEYNYVTVQNVDKSTGYNVTLTNVDGTAIGSWPYPAGSWTTNPFPAALSKQNGGSKDHRQIYLPVGFTFKVNYQSTENGAQPWRSKLVTVATATTVTVSGTTYSAVDIP